jgi:hypothetical protein
MIPIPKVPTNKNESSKSKTPLTSRSLTTKSPRSARSNFSTGSNAIHQSTPKSIRISTKSYDIFIHEKTNSKEALPEDLIETAEMTRMLVKFIKESKFQVPAFLKKIEKQGNSFVPGVLESGLSDTVGAKERIKSYGGDKSINT